jgi:hypothetical protein
MQELEQRMERLPKVRKETDYQQTSKLLCELCVSAVNTSGD